MLSRTKPLICITVETALLAGVMPATHRTLTTTPNELFEHKDVLSLRTLETRQLLDEELRKAEFMAIIARIHSPSTPASAIITKIFVPPLIDAGYEAKQTDILPDGTPYLCTDEGYFPILYAPQLNGEFEALLAAKMLFIDSFPYGEVVDHGTFFHIIQSWFLQRAYENGLIKRPPVEIYQAFAEHPDEWITCRDNNDEPALESPRTGMLLEHPLPPPPGVIDEAWEKASSATIAGLMHFQATYPHLTKELVQARKEVQGLTNGKEGNDYHTRSFTVQCARRENSFSRGI